MPRFITPDPEQVRSVLTESHALWGAGLSVSEYISMWDELAETRWGRAWYSWRALVDGEGRVLSSLKLYRPNLRLGGEEGRIAAIGAVFTPPSFRRHGHAAALIRATLEESTARGDRASLLFTDIGTDYYRALGFAPLPCEDAIGTLPEERAPAAAGVRFRGMTGDDLDAVAAAHEAGSLSRPIAVVRDRDHWAFLLARAAGFFSRLDGSGLEHRFTIAERDGRAIGYLVGVLAPGEWNLREAASFDGEPRTLARILAAGGAEARAASASTVWGWLPRELWPLVPSWRLRSQPRLRAVPMIRVLDGQGPPEGMGGVRGAFIPYLDQF